MKSCTCYYTYRRFHLSAISISVVVAFAVLLSNSDHGGGTNPLYEGAERAARKAADSCDQIFQHAKCISVAAMVFWKSMRSVLSSVNHEVRSGFEIRVTVLLAEVNTLSKNL